MLGRFTAVSDDGLHDAIDELVKSKPGPLNVDQVTLVLIQRRMEEDQADCLDMCQTSWKEDVRGLFFCRSQHRFRGGTRTPGTVLITCLPASVVGRTP